MAGNKSKSARHWDTGSVLRDGGKIYVDEELIYENGTFTINV